MSDVINLFPPKEEADRLQEIKSYTDGSGRYQVALVTEADTTYPLTGGIPACHVIIMGIDGDQPGVGHGLEFLGSFTLDAAGRSRADMVGEAVALAVFQIECDLDPTPDLSARH